MATDHPPLFPIEIIERIIDMARQLQYGDKVVNFREVYAIWKTCALTCRAMVPRSQYWLFRWIEVASQLQAENLMRVLRENPRVAGYARSLSIQYRAPSEGEVRPNCTWVSWIPQVLAPRMTNLQSLHLGGDVVSSSHPDFLKGLAAFKSIRTLQLENVQFSTFGHCVRLIRVLPHLEHLALKYVSWKPQPPHFLNAHALYKTRARASQVDHLDVWSNTADGSELKSLVEWIVRIKLHESLQKLSLQVKTSDATSNLLRCASSTRSIFLMVDRDSPIPGFEHCSHLHTLHLWSEDKEFPVQAVTSILLSVSVSSRNVQKLVIYIHAADEDKENPRDKQAENNLSSYGRLDNKLCDLVPKGLELVLCLCTSVDVSTDAVMSLRQALYQSLPKFYQRAPERLRVESVRVKMPWKMWLRWCDDTKAF